MGIVWSFMQSSAVISRKKERQPVSNCQKFCKQGECGRYVVIRFDGLGQDRSDDIRLDLRSTLAGGVKSTHSSAHSYMTVLSHEQCNIL